MPAPRLQISRFLSDCSIDICNVFFLPRARKYIISSGAAAKHKMTSGVIIAKTNAKCFLRGSAHVSIRFCRVTQLHMHLQPPPLLQATFWSLFQSYFKAEQHHCSFSVSVTHLGQRPKLCYVSGAVTPTVTRTTGFRSLGQLHYSLLVLFTYFCQLD